MQRKHMLSYSLAVLIVISIALSSCTNAVKLGGIVKGLVYADVNGNGSIDPGEGPLNDATVSLSDCGPILTQTTAADGTFNFTNLPEGTCHVTVAKTGWTFSGSVPNLGYPLPVASNPDLPTTLSIAMAPMAGMVTPTSAETPTATLVSATNTQVQADTTVPTDTATIPSIPVVTPLDKDVNCRFGPSTAYLAVGFLKAGQNQPILGTSPDHGWWQIQNPQDIKGNYCWVGSSVTKTLGDLSLVKVVKVPVGLVTSVTVSTTAVIHGTCSGSNPSEFNGYITTNGPTTVYYHWEIYVSGGGLLDTSADQVMTFSAAGTQNNYPGGFPQNCGSYTVKMVVTSPNSISGQASWQVVSP